MDELQSRIDNACREALAKWGPEHQLSGSEILLLCLAIIPIALWEAYVVKILWAWFLVPMGLPELSLLAAWALKTMTHSSAFTKKDNKDISLWRMLTVAFGGPACVLGICWIVKAVLL